MYVNYIKKLHVVTHDEIKMIGNLKKGEGAGGHIVWLGKLSVPPPALLTWAVLVYTLF